MRKTEDPSLERVQLEFEQEDQRTITSLFIDGKPAQELDSKMLPSNGKLMVLRRFRFDGCEKTEWFPFALDAAFGGPVQVKGHWFEWVQLPIKYEEIRERALSAVRAIDCAQSTVDLN